MQQATKRLTSPESAALPGGGDHEVVGAEYAWIKTWMRTEESTAPAPRFEGDGLPSMSGVVAGDMAHTVAAGCRALYQLLASRGPRQRRRCPPPHSAKQHFPLLRFSSCYSMFFF